MACLALLAFLAITRVWDDGVQQSPLFRLISLAWVLLNAHEATRLPGLNIEPRRLYHYANRDFDDAFLIGSAVITFALAAALSMTASGLGRARRWAIWSFVSMTSVAALVIVAYDVWCLSQGAPAGFLAAIAFTAAVPAALATISCRQPIQPDPVEHDPSWRRNSLIRPALLLLFSAHALLVVPAFACVCVLVGVFVRQFWLAWAS